MVRFSKENNRRQSTHNLQLELSVPYYINKDDPHRRYREGYNKYKISPDKADFPKEVARVMTVFKPLLKELMKQ